MTSVGNYTPLGPGAGLSIDLGRGDKAFYVLEGQIEFLLDGQWRRATAGSTVFIPAGTVHAFRNATDRRAHQLG